MRDKPVWVGKEKLAAVLGAIALGGAAQAGAKQPSRCDNGAAVVPSPAGGEPTLQKKCLAEAIGTGIIVHGGCGVVCASKFCGSAIGPGAIAAVWGISVALAVYATRDISGAHLNPAVTCSLAVNKDFPKEDVAPFVCAQTLGATVAGVVNYLICSAGIAALEAEQCIVRGTAASSAIFSGAFGMSPNPKLLTTFGAFGAEVWMTAVLAFMIFAITDPASTMPTEAAGPLLIGATVATLVAVFGPVTGCGMNPARDLGPRLVTYFAGFGASTFPAAWIYTVGPIAGAILGGAFYQTFIAGKK